jgi:hypothetical protein
MSGATAAHASYNGSGTQGLAVTNKINDTGDIVSVLWNKDKTTKQLLHGSAIIEIPASGDSSKTGSNVIFTLNSDMDCIGDLFLYVKLTQGTTKFSVEKEYGLLNLIERVEFQCGTQIWQTLEFADILALNSTELTEGAYERFILSTMGMESTTTGINRYRGLDVTVSGATLADFVFCVKLPLLTRGVGPILNNFSNISEDGFLTAGAPNQTVKIKVYTNSVATMVGNNMLGGSSPSEATMDLKLYGKHLIMCNEEREQIRNIPGGLAKRVKLTQYKEELANTPSSNIHTMELDCDHFSLFASHLIIQIFDTTPMNNAILETTENLQCSLLEADLKLNSTSFCGKLIGGLMTGPLPESLGVYVNGLYTVTDPRVRTFTYVFPLADKAFSGSGVPLNRFDNIRLAVKVHHPAGSSTFKKITVTCVGETTALYRQGAASISMY